MRWNLLSWEKAVKEKQFPHPGNSLQQVGDEPGQIWSFEAQRKVQQPAVAGRTERDQ